MRESRSKTGFIQFVAKYRYTLKFSLRVIRLLVTPIVFTTEISEMELSDFINKKSSSGNGKQHLPT